MVHIDWLTEIEGAEYGYVTGGEQGGLVLRSETGDTHLPPYEGRFTILEAVDSREDAREWELQSA